jgi:hypothetical protein
MPQSDPPSRESGESPESKPIPDWMRAAEYTDDPCYLPDDEPAPIPSKSLEDYWDVIGRDGKTKVDPEKLGQQLCGRRWNAETGTWEEREEYLYPVFDDPDLPPGDRRVIEGVLFFLPFHAPEEVPLPWEIPWPPRKLDKEDTARWYMLSDYKLPRGLDPVPIHGDPTQDPSSRLCREWHPAGPAPPSRQDGQAPPPSEPEQEATPLEQTLTKLKRTSVAKTLVKYVDAQAGGRTKLDPLVRHLNKGREPTSPMREKTKQLVRRTAALLDERAAPLRLEWDWNRDFIELNERPARATYKRK